MARSANYDSRLVSAVHEVNETQKLVLFQKIVAHFGSPRKGKGAEQPQAADSVRVTPFEWVRRETVRQMM